MSKETSMRWSSFDGTVNGNANDVGIGSGEPGKGSVRTAGLKPVNCGPSSPSITLNVLALMFRLK